MRKGRRRGETSGRGEEDKSINKRVREKGFPNDTESAKANTNKSTRRSCDNTTRDA